MSGGESCAVDGPGVREGGGPNVMLAASRWRRSLSSATSTFWIAESSRCATNLAAGLCGDGRALRPRAALRGGAGSVGTLSTTSRSRRRSRTGYVSESKAGQYERALVDHRAAPLSWRAPEILKRWDSQSHVGRPSSYACCLDCDKRIVRTLLLATQTAANTAYALVLNNGVRIQHTPRARAIAVYSAHHRSGSRESWR
jgi:hypothetical protein